MGFRPGGTPCGGALAGLDATGSPDAAFAAGAPLVLDGAAPGEPVACPFAALGLDAQGRALPSCGGNLLRLDARAEAQLDPTFGVGGVAAGPVVAGALGYDLVRVDARAGSSASRTATSPPTEPR